MDEAEAPLTEEQRFARQLERIKAIVALPTDREGRTVSQKPRGAATRLLTGRRNYA